MNYIAEQIKQRVPLIEAIENYTGERFIKNKICCPLHSEKTASFTIYPNGKYYCFGCGESGDIISFVMKYFNIGFSAALFRLDYDFNLGLYNRPTITEHRRRQREAAEIKKAQQRAKDKARELDAAYWEAFDRVLYYERLIEQYRPNSPEDEPLPQFIEALQNIEYAKHLLDCAEIERSKQKANER